MTTVSLDRALRRAEAARTLRRLELEETLLARFDAMTSTQRADFLQAVAAVAVRADAARRKPASVLRRSPSS